MNVLFGAKSGHGKSFHAQAYIEENIRSGDYDCVVVLDFKDEFRGLVKEGFARHWLVGPREAEHFTADHWRQLAQRNDAVVLAKKGLDAEEWKDTCAGIIDALRGETSVLIAIDEAHFVAPQDGKLPKPTKGLATTGRGEQASSMWIFQRPALLDNTIIGQADAYLLGAFNGTDTGPLADHLEYPVDVHDSKRTAEVSHLPDELCVPGEGAIPLRKFENDTGDTIGSEWIWSDDKGNIERLDTRNITMVSTHYGAQGKDIKRPQYG